MMTRLLLLSASLSLLMGCASSSTPAASQGSPQQTRWDGETDPAPADEGEGEGSDESDLDTDSDEEHDATECLVDRCPTCTQATEEPEDDAELDDPVLPEDEDGLDDPDPLSPD